MPISAVLPAMTCHVGPPLPADFGRTVSRPTHPRQDIPAHDLRTADPDTTAREDMARVVVASMSGESRVARVVLSSSAAVLLSSVDVTEPAGVVFGGPSAPHPSSDHPGQGGACARVDDGHEDVARDKHHGHDNSRRMA